MGELKAASDDCAGLGDNSTQRRVLSEAGVTVSRWVLCRVAAPASEYIDSGFT